MAAMTRMVSNVEIVWSSGTGNSRRAAVWFETFARIRNCVVGLRDAHEPAPNPKDLDLLVLIYPTHGFTAPWSVFRYLFQLPKGGGAKAALIATRGGGWYLLGPLPGCAATATWLPALILFFKGYQIRGLTGLDLPSNWNALHPGMNATHARFFLRRARVKVRRFASRMIEGRTWVATPCNGIELLVGLTLLPVSLGYLFLGRCFLSQLFFADHRCDRCGLCIQACPEKAIRGVKGHPRWTLHCESCHRCMAICPRQAVQAHHGLALFGVWLVGFVMVLLAVHHIPRVLKTLLEWTAMAGFLFLLQHVVARLSGRCLAAVSVTSLTRWYRRYREPATCIGDLRPR
jgi:Pyruvate/2-oxoacid:ferredoxin oxidoreductase delta subunit